MQTDLGDIVYKKDIPSKLFVNTYGSEMMTTLLVVVQKKKIDQFLQLYPELLVQYNEVNFDTWCKITTANLNSKNQNIEDEG